MKWIDYREKLGIGFNDETKFRMLSNMLQNYVETIVGDAYTESSHFAYCQMVGEQYRDNARPYHYLRDSLADCRSVVDLISHYIAFCNTYRPEHSGYSYRVIEKNEVVNYLEQILSDINIGFEVLNDKDGVFIFPKGAKELDNALVSEPLEWLNEYPQTRKEWIDALKDYSNSTSSNASEVADKFRKTLERFFQEFFGKTQTLENLKSEYGKYMKAQGVPPEISNNFESLHQSYTNFMNGYAKHHDKTSKNVLEYIMYQTGNIIRLLITLKKGETT